MIIGSPSERKDSVAAPERVPGRWPHATVCAAFCAYAGLLLAAIYHHEPWADEAQAWLIARDASLWEIWTSLLHYEGSPGLWHTLLHVLSGAGLSYSAFSYLSAMFACAGAWLMLKYSPFPLAIRLLLPFTFFLGYQYAVVARSYDVLPVLIFGAAMLYDQAERRPGWFGTLLCLMAMVSVHGLILSGCVVVSFAIFRWNGLDGLQRRRLLWALGVYSFVATTMCLVALPAHDEIFVTQPKFSVANWWEFSSYTFRETFTGEGISASLAVGLSIPLLWRGRGLLLFAMAASMLCTFGAVVYGAVWHQGVLFLAWVFALWISTASPRRPGRLPQSLAWAGLAIVIPVQAYWTFASVKYDWTNAYSAGKKAAQFLKSSGISDSGVYTVGYASTAVQPYFPVNVSGRAHGYWDWSNRNKIDDVGNLLASRGRGHVLVGYKLPEVREHWAGLMRVTGYDLVRHFEGNLFWHTKTYEAESFDLYRWNPSDGNQPKLSTIAMNDQAGAGQLLSGFHPLEANAWRWTERNFAVMLKATGGGRLRLALFVPDTQIKSLGPMTVRAEINEQSLAEQTFSREGAQVYEVSLPDLPSGPVLVTFHLDKAKAPTATDARELGVIVTSVGIVQR
jgi:hypothetical protein